MTTFNEELVEFKTMLGYSAWRWRTAPVALISNEYLSCCVYVYPTTEEANASARTGGTGFVIAVPSVVPEYYHLYVATNKHNIYDEPRNLVIRLNTVEQRKDTIETKIDDWEPSEDSDLAVYHLLVTNDKYDVVFIVSDQVMTKEKIHEKQVGIGDEVFLVGKFPYFEGLEKNTPVARFGHISMMPGEPDIHWPIPSKVNREVFLVEIQTRTGFSGSPVFVYYNYPVPTPDMIDFLRRSKRTVIGPWLLGVHCGQVKHEEPGKDTGMSVVVPSWKLIELLKKEKLVTRRKGLDDKKLEEIRKEKEDSGIELESEGLMNQQGFLKTLKQVSRKLPAEEPSQPDEEKKET